MNTPTAVFPTFTTYLRRPARLGWLPIALLAASATAAPCSPADLTADGQVDFGDYLEFLNRFDAGDLSVDYTGDGQVDFGDYLEFLNFFDAGCSASPPVDTELAGNPLGGYPFFEFVQSFNTGSVVSIAVDPLLHPSIVGLTADVYIVAARSQSQWDADPALVDVRGTPQAMSFDSGMIQANAFPLTGSAPLAAGDGLNIGAAYDLVIDLDRDGTLSGGDLGDGLGDDAGFFIVKNLTAAGPLAVTFANVSVSVGSVTAGFEDERWCYPSDIATRGRLPVVIISHGNGHNYTWYDYLQSHLASHGYITMSHENNTGPGIETASTTTLQHTQALIAQQATLGGGALNNHIDTHRIMWVGHSRGGEGVVRAYDRIFDGQFIPTNYVLSDVALISSIAPTDRLTTAGADPHAANYHLIYGSADGDELAEPCDSASSSSPFPIYERGTGRKQSTYVHGADHNDFNCCGFEDFVGPAGTAIGRTEAQQVAKGVFLALTKLYFEGQTAGREYLWRQYERFRPLGVSSSTVVVNEYDAALSSERFMIDDFETQPTITVSSCGGAVTATVGNLVEGLMRDADCSYQWAAADPMNGMTRAVASDTSRGAVFDWSLADRALGFGLPSGSRDLTSYTYLSMRACQGTRHPETIAELSDLTFTVTLFDDLGGSSSINIGVYGGGIEEPYQRTGSGTGAGWTNEFETIRIRLTDFTHNGSGLDLSRISAVQFNFGPSYGSSRGRLGFDDLEVVK